MSAFSIPPAITDTATDNSQFSHVFIIRKNLQPLFEASESQAQNQYEYGKFIKGERSEYRKKSASTLSLTGS